MTNLSDRRYQVVYITLADGREGRFTGPVLAEPGEPPQYIRDIRFSEPKIMPEDCSWSVWEKENE